MMKISYPVKILFLSFTCEDITVVIATSVSANEIYKHFMPYCSNIYLFSALIFSIFGQTLIVRKIYILLD